MVNRRQPPAGTNIDWNNSLTNGLREVFVWNAANINAQKLVNPEILTLAASATMTQGVSSGEIGVRPGTDDSQNRWLTGNNYGMANTEGSILLRSAVDWSFGAAQTHADSMMFDDSNGHTLLYYNDGTHVRYWYNRDNALWDLTYFPADVWGPEEVHTFCGSVKSGAQHLAVDGIIRDTDTVAQTYHASLGSQFAIGRAAAAASTNRFVLCMIWDRAISQLENKTITANPWQIFKPQSLYVPMIAGAEVAVEAGPPLASGSPQISKPTSSSTATVVAGGTLYPYHVINQQRRAMNTLLTM